MNDYNFFDHDQNNCQSSFGDYTDPTPGVPEQEPPKQQPSKKGNAKRIAALVLCCAVIGGASGMGGAALYASMNGSGPSAVIFEGNRPKVQTVTQGSEDQLLTTEQLYAANVGSCVGITVSTTSMNIFGQTSTSAASGSGFVLTEDGYIVTNYHVIEDAAEDSNVTVEVSFANGDKYQATLVGGEQDNDVAVLKINATGLTPVTLGDSSELVVGESVYVIGNPLGELTYSLSDGIVSALDRLITTSSTNAKGQTESVTLNVLQTNCAINPGNSGGPLFDSYGNVVGIVSAKYTQSSSGVSAEGLGFALPINDVKDILTDLIEHGYVTGKPYLGIQVSTVSSDAQRYGIPAGASVEYVADGSCAQKAGLQVGDIIVAIDDTAIDSPSALTAALSSNYKAGDTATLTVIRQQQEQKLTVTFDEKNSDTEANNQQQTTQSQSSGNSGNSESNESYQGSQGSLGGYYYNQTPFGRSPW